ncbi:hypothetical protein JWJ90_09495 [Desulfobulbus rhabdoformis]|jgi:hypothetical protein|uniref:hypothetical protein n=1 Tax=Desulfobulbus rhabdoformis TaxID=34032 RepID=UPI001965E764|nr:hypothetical protein [Desulfobulbus rhabdoformis]MBM9614523.1 hypothetical protein [Desulfobulbus rhabdoformis]
MLTSISTFSPLTKQQLIDFAHFLHYMKHLPGILQEFSVNHPQVQVDVFCEDIPHVTGKLNALYTT